MEQMIFLHDHIMTILTLIIIIVFYVLFLLKFNNKTMKFQSENHTLEALWTLLPGLVLILIAFPSLRILYLSEETENNPMMMKSMGHQWYWTYEYVGFLTTEFDSFMNNNLKNNSFRLLDTDTIFNIPTKTPIQFFISSSDVLHAWTIPTLGIKTDSVPGRINTVNFMCLKSGIFYGQCSEICGTNHSFMPIMMKTQPLSVFKTQLPE